MYGTIVEVIIIEYIFTVYTSYFVNVLNIFGDTNYVILNLKTSHKIVYITCFYFCKNRIMDKNKWTYILKLIIIISG